MFQNRGMAAAIIGAAIAMAPATVAQELRIGFLNTTTGGGALIGKHMENGWKLGLEHEGWTKDGDKRRRLATRLYDCLGRAMAALVTRP